MAAKKDQDVELTRAEVADLLGVAPGTWGAYVTRGQGVAPVRYVGRTPVWSKKAVQQWSTQRPGKGAPGHPRRRKSAEPAAD